MKVALLASAANRHTHRWAIWLARHGHRVAVFSDRPPRGDMDYSSVPLYHPRWSLLQKLLTFKLSTDPLANNRHKWKAYRSLIQSFQPDVLHAQEALGYGPILSHFPQYPRVLTPWGPEIERLGKGDPRRDQLVRQAAAAADVISTNGPGLEEEWAQRLQLPATRFRFFSWGVNTALFKPATPQQQEDVRRKAGLRPGTPFLLSPRLATPYYRIDYLIEGWKLAREEEPLPLGLRNAHFVVLRAGADEASWDALLRKARSLVDDTVHFVEDYFSPAEMAALYTAAEAVPMLPETDLLAMSLLEAAACGSIPIIPDLPTYASVFCPLEERSGTRAHALLLRQHTPEAVAAAFRRWGALRGEEKSNASRHNERFIQKHHDMEKCLGAIEEVYAEAIARKRSRDHGS